MHSRMVYMACVGIVASVTAGCGWGGATRLQPTDALILYSIDGNDYPDGKRPEAAEQFHGYPVLGKMEVANAAKRDAIVAAVNDGLDRPEPEMKCFWPRHGIRVERDGRTIDYVICYECRQLDVYVGDRLPVRYPTGTAPLETLNKLLTEEGIPLAPSRLNR